ncbi:DeoR/GlpR family DNA-binding transcription regulator [Clostridium septicum]|uniref:Lactose phosphotransferase system repressor n=1 Tax=Clostridium septicum TaxID=1504 RepID=A0A9N7JIL6_CLOSE|nr:DeoR/GlpR family DNA-binding transcription regulator [Clostridium septicum]AYE32989.1 DeoR/GlpR transcriptional regulator [Clostridium septicum]MDU1314204.1 DeoR/GlpR family DNA-binding transcription regulator [Clostridium septicum]QAS61143.1 DeoR/GlpR transcriptional regulator [Clostridium septicum]UEC19495.1 DeoR/GlpR family DNA-binding transcription regulator [Clostridium septicum]USR99552.1 DeoR/GlpR family DNA-binding transcription regulator [Clostridium septicum]
MTSRYTKLLEIVNENKRIEVSKLAELLNVSQVTVRKDLDVLCERGLLKREHGYAVTTSTSDDINSRLAFNYNIKRKIANLASELVVDGETVMVESGSSCALLAEELAYNKKDITIITNSVFIASHIREGNAKVVLLGGDYQPESQVVVGPLTKKCVEDFFVDKLFVGTDGYNSKIGFTGKNLMRTETVKVMSENANKLIILTESSKFSERGVVSQFKTEEVDYVITDDNIPKDVLENLKNKNIEVKMVKVD